MKVGEGLRSKGMEERENKWKRGNNIHVTWEKRLFGGREGCQYEVSIGIGREMNMDKELWLLCMKYILYIIMTICLMLFELAIEIGL